MTWARLYYGSETPSLARRFFTNALMLSVAIACYGWWVDFVPSAAWLTWGTYLAVAAAVPCTAWFYWRHWTGHGQGGSRALNLFLYLFMPFFFFGFFWLILVQGIADLATLAAGTSHSDRAELRKRHEPNGRSCGNRLHGEALAGAFPDYVCVSDQLYQALPAGPVVVTVHGKKSPLGLHVSKVSWHPPSTAPAIVPTAAPDASAAPAIAPMAAPAPATAPANVPMAASGTSASEPMRIVFIIVGVAMMLSFGWYFRSRQSQEPTATERVFATGWLWFRRLVCFAGSSFCALIAVLLSIDLVQGKLPLTVIIGIVLAIAMGSIMFHWGLYGTGQDRYDSRDDKPVHEQRKRRYGWRR